MGNFLRFKVMWKLLMICVLILTACQERNDVTIHIAIQPLGKNDKKVINDIKLALKSTYGANVSILQEREIYERAFVQIKSPRYRADTLLQLLKADLPDGYDYILGVTNHDISTTKYDAFPKKIKEPVSKYRDWGVFGLGYMPGNSCIVSTFSVGKVNETLKILRMQKISVHEVGHNLGLPHCSNKSCVMTDAVERVSTIDNAKLELCEKCKKKL